MNKTIFRPGDKVVWINAANKAVLAFVVEEFHDLFGVHRVMVEMPGLHGVSYRASPTFERVGHLGQDLIVLLK